MLVFEHKALFADRGEVERGSEVPLGVAEILRPGRDVTVVATQLMVQRSMAAARALASEGIEAEVIDPRTLAPLDLETIAASVARTGRLVCAQESPSAGGWGATVIAAITERCFDHLDAPPSLMASDDTPVPYSGDLEARWLPTDERIADAVRRSMAH